MSAAGIGSTATAVSAMLPRLGPRFGPAGESRRSG